MASNNNTLARKDYSVATSKKKECKVFEPQTWRKNVCRNCYRTVGDHPEPSTDSPATEGSSAGSGSSASVNPPTKPESPNSNRRHSSTSSGAGNEKSKTSSPRESKKLSNTSSNRSAASRQSPKRSNSVGVGSASRSSTRVSSTDPKYVEELENDFFDLEDKYAALGREKDELELETEEKSKCVHEIQEQVNEYKTKVVLLEKKINHLEDEIRGYRERLKLPESEQAGSVPSASAQAAEEMRQRVDEVETLCQNLMEENEMLKEEIDEMQREIEEMHDHFQEDDTDTLRELQRELEASNKNCRIFQFKLRKAERRFEQCEAERLALEEKLQRLEMQIYNEEDRNHIRMLEEELRIAKEVSVRLNNELDLVDEKRGRYEMENRNLKEEIQSSEGKRIHAENEVGRLRLEIDKIRNDLGVLEKGPLQVTDKNQSRPRLTPNRSLSREPSFEEQQLQRELDATKERETDVAEQLRFAEEETRKLKRRLNDVEDENDALTRKLETIVSTKSRLGSDSEIEDDETNSHGRLQMQLLEQETDVLRKKVVTLEKENQFIKQHKDKDTLSTSVSSFSSDGSSLSADMDQLRREFTHVKAKLGETAAENERLERDNQRLASLATMPPSKGSLSSRLVPIVSVDPPEERNDTHLRSENQELRAQLRELDRQLREAVENVSRRCSTTESKERELFEKYNDALDMVKDKESEIARLKKKLTDSQDELVNLKKEALQKKEDNLKKESTPDSKRKRERHQATRDNLLEQLTAIEKEHESALARVELLQKRENELNATKKEQEESLATAQEDFESRERELLSVISSVEIKNGLLDGLLKLVQSRADQVQEELDKLHEVSSSPKRNSSTMSDDVFEAAKEIEAKESALVESSEKLKSRIRSLERLLAEERQKNVLVQKKSELSFSRDLPRRQSSVEVSNQMTEALKNDIEEKDEIISEKERLIADLKNRLEQQRKINDAMRALVDKDETENDRKKMCDTHKLELSSYVKEVESIRGEVQTLTNRLNEANKAKEKQYKDNMNLLQELKIREESVFEQDDELNQKNCEIRNLSRQLESEQSMVKKLKNDLKNTDSNNKSLEEFENKVSSLNREIDHLNHELADMRTKITDREIDLSQSEEKAKLLGDAVRNRDERIREKDELIQHINQRLQNREAEMNDLDRLLSQTTEKLGVAEIEIKELNLKQGEQEREIKLLLSKFEEVRTTSESQANEMEKVNRQMEDLVREHKNCLSKHEALESENSKLRERLQSKEASSSENAEATATAVSAANAATERIRKELQTLKMEFDEREKAAEKEKRCLEKKLQFANARSDSIEADSKSSETNSESQKQKTKLLVMNEQISKLNRMTIELKLQNESLQRDILENQRKYRMINEQYQAEREAWLSEKSLFEMKLKEHEDRKSALQAARQALSLVTAENSTLEADIRQLRLDSDNKIASLEKDNSDLKIKAGVNDEQQKMPKVLQRLNRGKTPVVMETSWEKEKTEITVRLERTEKALTKLRQEIFDNDEKHSKEKEQILKEHEDTRNKLEQDVMELRHVAARTLAIQQQLDACHERLREIEDAQEREQRMWQQERVQLQYRLEEGKLHVEQWLSKLKESSDLLQSDDKDIKENQCDSILKNMTNDMEKYLKSKEKMSSSVTTRRRWNNSQEPSEMSPNIGGSFTPLTVPRTQHQSAQHLPSSLGHRSTSMEWSQNALLQALDRSSSSADVSVKKISNYPDPTGGFLLRVSSRQNSSDSIASMPPTYLSADQNTANSSIGNTPYTEDYTQRSFTMPSKPFSSRSKMSPARQKFFDNYESRLKSDSVQSLLSIESSNLGSSHKPPLPPTSTPSKVASSSVSLRETTSLQSVTDDPSSAVSSATSSKLGIKKEPNKVRSFFSSQLKKSDSTSKIHTVNKERESKADQLKSFFSKRKTEKSETQSSNKATATTSTTKEDALPSAGKSPQEPLKPPTNKEPTKKSIIKDSSTGKLDIKEKEKSLSNLKASNTSIASSGTPKQVKFESEKPGGDSSSTKQSTSTISESSDMAIKDKQQSEASKESSVPSKSQNPPGKPTGKNDSNPPAKIGLGVSISERRKLFGGPAKTTDSSTKPFWMKK